jgi:hypothetical protein
MRSPRTQRRAVTTLRPPQKIADAIDCHAHHWKLHRSEVIRGALDSFLSNPGTHPPHGPVRLLYAKLNSKLVAAPLAFSCDPGRLKFYRQSADELGYGSLAGLVSIAVASVHRIEP